jgi:hypothetical protein
MTLRAGRPPASVSDRLIVKVKSTEMREKWNGPDNA